MEITFDDILLHFDHLEVSWSAINWLVTSSFNNKKYTLYSRHISKQAFSFEENALSLGKYI